MNKSIPAWLIIIFLAYLVSLSSASGTPIINYVSPDDGARLESNPILIVNVSNNKSMNIVWYFRESGATYWENIGENLSIKSGLYRQNIPNGTKEGINYQWRINISDNDSYVNQTFNFRRRGWQVIQEKTNISFYSPDSSKNISVYSLEGENAFSIIFDMKFYVYNGTILVKYPGRLDNIAYNANNNGFYEDISVDIKKDNPIFFPPGYQGSITIERPDGREFSFDTNYKSDYGRWTVEIRGNNNKLDFFIYYATDWIRAIIYIFILLIPISLNVLTWKKKSLGEMAIGSTILIIPAILFPLLESDIPPQSIEMIIVYILSVICSIISFSHWRIIQKIENK